MKATFKRESLLAAFLSVSPAVPSKNNTPILTYIKMTVVNGTATLYGTDSQIGLQSTITGVDSQQNGVVLLDNEKLGKILKQVPDELISFTLVENVMKIKANRSKFDIATADSASFPAFPDYDDAKHHSVASLAFKTMLSRVQFCADNGGRYATDGVLFECNDGEMIVVATDTIQIAKMNCKAESVNGHLNAATIVPKASIPVISKAVTGQDIKITCTQNSVFLKTDTTMGFARLLEGKFPPWRKGIDRKMPDGFLSLELKTEELSAAVSQASIVGMEDSGIFFTAEDGVMSIKGSGESGSSEAEIPIEYQGQQCVVCVKKSAIQGCLRSIASCPSITLQMCGRADALKISTNDGFQYVAMPMNAVGKE